MDENPDELALVIKALTCGVGGCVEWNRKEAERVRRDRFLKGLTPDGVQGALIDYVKNHNGRVLQ
jgi:hypothetical protein